MDRLKEKDKMATYTAIQQAERDRRAAMNPILVNTWVDPYPFENVCETVFYYPIYYFEYVRDGGIHMFSPTRDVLSGVVYHTLENAKSQTYPCYDFSTHNPTTVTHLEQGHGTSVFD